MAHARLSVAAAVALALAACGPDPRPPLPPPPPSSTAPPPQGDGAWGTYASTRFRARLKLPDGAAWRIDDHKSSWLVATHDATKSEIAFRLWIEADRTNRSICEDKARETRAIASREGADIVDRRRVAIPPEFDTEITIGVFPPPKPGAPLRGFVHAFGGKTRRCFAFVYTTEESGSGAEERLGDRLAAIAEETIGKLVVENDLEPKPFTPR